MNYSFFFFWGVEVESKFPAATPTSALLKAHSHGPHGYITCTLTLAFNATSSCSHSSLLGSLSSSFIHQAFVHAALQLPSPGLPTTTSPLLALGQVIQEVSPVNDLYLIFFSLLLFFFSSSRLFSSPSFLQKFGWTAQEMALIASWGNYTHFLSVCLPVCHLPPLPSVLFSPSPLLFLGFTATGERRRFGGTGHSLTVANEAAAWWERQINGSKNTASSRHQRPGYFRTLPS